MINIVSAKLVVVRILLRLRQFAHHPPQNYHLMRKVFCGDGAWLAVPYRVLRRCLVMGFEEERVLRGVLRRGFETRLSRRH